MQDYIPVFVILFLVAAIVRDDTILSIFYLLAAIYLTGVWWSRRALHNITFERQFSPYAFLDHPLPVRLKITNRGWLPAVWVRAHESLPVELASPTFYEHVFSLGGHARAEIDYTLHPRRRGYYPLGPLFLASGDLLGMTHDQQIEGGADMLTVYPRIVPLQELGLPSRTPFGLIRHPNPLYEDPSRIRGKREYRPTDSLRRVDWKTSAATGNLQVKLFETAIAFETCIILNLDPQDYQGSHWIERTELAIVAAASLANWVTQQKQPTGLATNGADPLAGDHTPQPLPPRKGNPHLMQLLALLARIQPAHAGLPFAQFTHHASAGLAWGTTLILVTGRITPDLIDELLQARRRGLSASIVTVHGPALTDLGQHNAGRLGFSVYPIQFATDLQSLHVSDV